MNIDFISDTEYTVSGLHIRNALARRYCVFDFEATGPNHKDDRITRIGAVIVENFRVQAEHTFTTLVRSPKRIPEAIERLTGITDSDIANAPAFSDVYGEFAGFSKGTVLVTQAGYEFDWPLLDMECRRSGLPMVTNPIVDTKALFTYLYPDVSDIVSTNYLIRRFEIDDSDIKRHSALGDSILIGRIFVKLLKELQARSINDIRLADPVTVKRMKLPPIS